MKLVSSIFLCAALITLSAADANARPSNHHRHGHVIKVLPKSHHVVRVSGSKFYVHGGVYYRAHKGRYRVVAAPIGVRINVLPADHTSFYLGHHHYYFAAGNYYRQVGKQYVVVEKPSGAPAPATSVATTSGVPSLYIYPALDQSAKQLRKDKEYCQDWANDQPQTNSPKAFKRGYAACLEGSGYIVK